MVHVGKYTVFLGLSPCPVTVTTRIIRFLVGDPYYKTFICDCYWEGEQPNVYHTSGYLVVKPKQKTRLPTATAILDLESS